MALYVLEVSLDDFCLTTLIGTTLGWLLLQGTLKCDSVSSECLKSWMV